MAEADPAADCRGGAGEGPEEERREPFLSWTQSPGPAVLRSRAKPGDPASELAAREGSSEEVREAESCEELPGCTGRMSHPEHLVQAGEEGGLPSLLHTLNG
ncbi:UNVERIFIED_CONTAM: hypothetical protein FKN15_010266 [Acipenser sinensis]